MTSDISPQALRGRQKRLLRRYREAANNGHIEDISGLVTGFLDNFEIEERMYDYIGMEVQYYPIFFDNVFRSMGFKLYAGELPSISGITPRFKTLPYFVAVDSRRAILLGSDPKSLFAEMADIQPVCPLPIIGLCYNTWARVKEREIDDWDIQNRKVATALGLSFISINSTILRKGIELSYLSQVNEIRNLAFKLGLPQMLSLSVENLAVYGTFQASRLSWPFNEGHFVSMCDNSIRGGHELGKGKLTKIVPIEAIKDPEWFFRELSELDLIRRKGKNTFDITIDGNDFIKQKIRSTPQEAALYSLSVNLRDEMKEGFNSILQQLKIESPIITDRVELFVDDIDSFSEVRSISRSMVKEPVLNEDFVQIKLEEILGEPWHKKDWGGESCDLYTSNLRVKGKRYRAAFLLKGSGTKGRLTIAKCGKNGDQIQRLFKCPADVFIIQHISEIDETVIEEARQKTISVRLRNPKTRFCIIDGLDTQRLIQAYSDSKDDKK